MHGSTAGTISGTCSRLTLKRRGNAARVNTHLRIVGNQSASMRFHYQDLSSFKQHGKVNHTEAIRSTWDILRQRVCLVSAQKDAHALSEICSSAWSLKLIWSALGCPTVHCARMTPCVGSLYKIWIHGPDWKQTRIHRRSHDFKPLTWNWEPNTLRYSKEPSEAVEIQTFQARKKNTLAKARRPLLVEDTHQDSWKTPMPQRHSNTRVKKIKNQQITSMRSALEATNRTIQVSCEWFKWHWCAGHLLECKRCRWRSMLLVGLETQKKLCSNNHRSEDTVRTQEFEISPVTFQDVFVILWSFVQDWIIQASPTFQVLQLVAPPNCHEIFHQFIQILWFFHVFSEAAGLIIQSNSWRACLHFGLHAHDVQDLVHICTGKNPETETRRNTSKQAFSIFQHLYWPAPSHLPLLASAKIGRLAKLPISMLSFHAKRGQHI